jgi:osmotically-inducible protein OsmY
MTWVVRAPAHGLGPAEKKLYTRVRRTLWDYEPLRASHAEIDIEVQGDQVRLRGRVRTLPQKMIAEALVTRMTALKRESKGLEIAGRQGYGTPDALSALHFSELGVMIG